MGLRVGEVALRAHVRPDTVRFYEEAGLLAPANRSHAGYRCFPEEVVERIRFIKRAQGLGFTLEEIAGLLDLRLRAGDACGPAQAAAEAKIAERRELAAFVPGELAQLRHRHRVGHVGVLHDPDRRNRGRVAVPEAPVVVERVHRLVPSARAYVGAAGQAHDVHPTGHEAPLGQARGFSVAPGVEQDASAAAKEGPGIAEDHEDTKRRVVPVGYPEIGSRGCPQHAPAPP